MDTIYFRRPYATNNNFKFFKYDTFDVIKLLSENNPNNQYVVFFDISMYICSIFDKSMYNHYVEERTFCLGEGVLKVAVKVRVNTTKLNSAIRKVNRDIQREIQKLERDLNRKLNK